MSTNELERKRFEDWAVAKPYPINRMPNGEYFADYTQIAWQAWQAQSARIADLEAECQRLREQLARDDERMGEIASKVAEANAETERTVSPEARGATQGEDALCECGHAHGNHYATEWLTVNKRGTKRNYLPCQGGPNEDCGCGVFRPVARQSDDALAFAAKLFPERDGGKG